MYILKFCPLLFLIIKALTQSDYILTSERAEVPSYNADYIIAKTHNFKYNRTCKAVNASFSIKRNGGNDLEAEVQAFRFASNEYRLFPLRFRSNVCEVFKKNDFGMQNLFKCGNFTGCPIKKGHYLICNWMPDYEKFPPYIPTGDYMVSINIFLSGHLGAEIQWYVKIEKKMRFP